MKLEKRLMQRRPGTVLMQHLSLWMLVPITLPLVVASCRLQTVTLCHSAISMHSLIYNYDVLKVIDTLISQASSAILKWLNETSCPNL